MLRAKAACYRDANVTGRDRIETLKDARSGAARLDELKAAYPAKDTAPPTCGVSTSGEKKVGADGTALLQRVTPTAKHQRGEATGQPSEAL